VIDQLIEFATNHAVLVGSFVVLLIVFLITESRRGAPGVSIHEATLLINKEKAIVLDLRSNAEFKAGHINDAVNLPYTSLASRISELDKYKGRPVILVCKMGQHAKAASKTLTQAGFDAKRLNGGMMEWGSANLPLVKG